MNSILNKIWRLFRARLPSRPQGDLSLAALKRRNLSFDCETARDMLRGRKDPAFATLAAAVQANCDSYPYQNFLASRDGDLPSAAWKIKGSWTIEQLDSGVLRLRGETPVMDCDVAGIFIDDRLIKFVNWKNDPAARDRRRIFDFDIKVKVLVCAPRRFRISIGTEKGPLLHADGKLHVAVNNPRKGDGSLFDKLANGYVINKKGVFDVMRTADKAWQQEVLDRYEMLRAYFKKTFDYDLFINYGTLLGCERNGDFIPHDDDFDMGYFSRRTTPEDIRAEMKDILARMVADGFMMRVPGEGSMFQHESGKLKVDIFPCWSEQGKIWMSNRTCITGGPDMFVPAREKTFKGRPVLVPNRALDFLSGKYGENWRVPDTGYFPVAAPGVIEYLLRSRMTAADVADIQRMAGADAVGSVYMGGVGSLDLGVPETRAAS